MKVKQQKTKTVWGYFLGVLSQIWDVSYQTPYNSRSVPAVQEENSATPEDIVGSVMRNIKQMLIESEIIFFKDI